MNGCREWTFRALDGELPITADEHTAIIGGISAAVKALGDVSVSSLVTVQHTSVTLGCVQWRPAPARVHCILYRRRRPGAYRRPAGAVVLVG